MDFFDKIILSNSIKNYCWVGGIILLVFLLKRYLSRYIVSLLFRMSHRIWKTLERKSFTDLVVEPLEWFLLILIVVFSVDRLNFPDAWQLKIYGHGTNEILTRLGIGIIIISFTWLLLRIIDFIALMLEKKASHIPGKNDDQLVVFFRDFFIVIIVIVGLLLVIKACFNQPIGTLLTSLSIVGAVLALAAKESLENLIASFIIFFDKPFATGDTLKVNTVMGVVEKIGLRSTRIRTVDKTLVTIPNKQMVDSVVDNWSMRTHRRAEMNIQLAVITPSGDIMHCIEGIKELLGKLPVITSFDVFLSELNKNGIVINGEYYTDAISLDQFNQLKETINISLKKILEDKRITLATPGNTVTVINEYKEV